MTAQLVGLDVSKWQGRVEFAGLDVDFICAKATHGERGVDSLFLAHRESIRRAEKPFGAYHWFLPTHDPIRQAEHFVSTVGVMRDDDFGFAIDVEDAESLSGNAVLDPLITMVCRVVELTGRRPWIYSADWFWAGKMGNLDAPLLAQCPLWVAQYPSTQPDRRSFRESASALRGAPRAPKPWASRGIRETCWQFDGDGGLRLSNGVDVDVNRLSAPSIATFAASQRCELLASRNVDDVATLQRTLLLLGHDCGKADGITGPKTQAAIDDFAIARKLYPYEIHDTLEIEYLRSVKRQPCE